MIAVPPGQHIAIVCPSWCAVPHAEHVEELPQQEGFVIHRSDRDRRVSHSSITYVNGMPDPDAEPEVYAEPPFDVSLDSMEAFAYEILAAVAEARSSIPLTVDEGV